MQVLHCQRHFYNGNPTAWAHPGRDSPGQGKSCIAPFQLPSFQAQACPRARYALRRCCIPSSLYPTMWAVASIWRQLMSLYQDTASWTEPAGHRFPLCSLLTPCRLIWRMLSVSQQMLEASATLTTSLWETPGMFQQMMRITFLT